MSKKVHDALCVEINVAVERFVVEGVVVSVAGFAQEGEDVFFAAAETEAAFAGDFQPFERAQDEVCHRFSLPRVFRRQPVRSGGKCSCRVRAIGRI